jgi:hypothetical protein
MFRAGLEAVLRRQIARQGVTRLLRCQRLVKHVGLPGEHLLPEDALGD